MIPERIIFVSRGITVLNFFEAQTNVIFPFYTALQFTAISLPAMFAAAIFCRTSGRPTLLPELNEASEEPLSVFPQPLLLVKIFYDLFI